MTVSRPRPPYSTGTLAPNSPNAFICSTIGVGNSSACSYAEATGMTSLRTQSRMVPMICSATSGSVGSTGMEAAMVPRLRSAG